jgi:hypothetical protein
LLAIVAVPAIFVPPFSSPPHRLRKFFEADRKKCGSGLLPAVARQNIEIPHDLAAGQARGKRRSQQIINLNN